MDHRRIHSPFDQTGMHRMNRRPACYQTEDSGNICACCYDPDAHQTHLDHTPGCEGCVSGQIAAKLYYIYNPLTRRR